MACGGMACGGVACGMVACGRVASGLLLPCSALAGVSQILLCEHQGGNHGVAHVPALGISWSTGVLAHSEKNGADVTRAT